MNNHITIEARLKLNQNDQLILNELMKNYSNCYHTIYNQLTRNETIISPNLQKQFNINARYVDAAKTEAEALYKANIELNNNQKKVIFGSKKSFEKLKKRH